jgi:hypothetical protein
MTMGHSGTDILSPTTSVGPEYKKEKPTATVSTDIQNENVHVLEQTPQLIALLTFVFPLFHVLLMLYADV